MFVLFKTKNAKINLELTLDDYLKLAFLKPKRIYKLVPQTFGKRKFKFQLNKIIHFVSNDFMSHDSQPFGGLLRWFI